MKIRNCSWRLIVIVMMVLFILTACNANPLDGNPDFTEISMEEAHNQIPELIVESYPYKATTPSEGRNFTPVGLTLEELMSQRAAEREKLLERKDSELDGKALRYFYGGLPGGGTVKVQLDGKTIFTAPYGDDSPIDPVGGLWVLDEKWILELIHINTRTENNTVYTDTRGDIIIDGKSMNERYGYDESFDFQILAGKAFYFYEIDGQTGFVYDGQPVQTGFSEVPHYACCSGAARNPFHFQNMVSFFAGKGEEKMYVEIGVYPRN